MTIEIAVMNYNLSEISVFKAEKDIIDDDYEGDVEWYLQEELGFKLSEISYMYGDLIKVDCYNGCPTGGLTVTENDINNI